MRKKRKRIVSLILSALMTVSIYHKPVYAKDVSIQNNVVDKDDLRLWYTKPASKGADNLTEDNMWQEYTLPIGNGDIGANVYGEIINERITFNEKTLWTGGPSTSRPKYNGGNKEIANNGKKMSEVLKEIRDLFALHTDEGNAKASELCNQLVGISEGYGAYQAWGEINLNFKGINEKNITNYMRDLNLKNAISSVKYTEGKTDYSREYFVSHPDDVMAIRVEAKGKNKLNFDVDFLSKQNGTAIAQGNTITLKGEVSDNKLKYNSKIKVVPDNGTVTTTGNKLTVKNATGVTIYATAATDYKNNYPVYRTGETDEQLDARVSKTINALDNKTYKEVKDKHIDDYQSIFNRMDLNLGQALPNIPTDELLSKYGTNQVSEEARRALEVMFFQYGRYLTIGASREDSQLPANLQGVWNNKNNPSWSSDYHMNVNLQMNYWPTYSTNMAECATPLVNYIDSLREPGRETARIYAGVESAKDESGKYIEQNGFMAHTQNTPFGWTCPGWSFDWGWSPAAVPWILQNVWEMYEYTGNVEYMRDVIYPIMKEEVNLYENMLVWDEVQQRMVSSPTYSPEHGPRTVGNTYEQTLIWQLYDDTITAAEKLGVDSDKVIKWKDTKSKLNPIQIGNDGQIKEWYEETTLGSIKSEGYGHRHMSHLLGLFPGDYISVETPELLDAALVSLKNRTDVSTGWGMGQRINTWARAGQGNKAYELITKQLKRVGTGQAGGGGTYSNLWDAHPPFQIDGNFGATAGISEMLMQSNMGYINFLPALPDVWKNGSYNGLVARGNFEVGAKWKDGEAYELTIKSKNGGKVVAKYAGLNIAKVTNSKGEDVNVTIIDEDKISFDTTKNETYTITQIPSEEKLLDAPTGLVAEKIESDSVELEWNALENDNVTYNVYRQINNGDIQAISKEINEAKFKDDTAKDILGTFSYMVSANIDGKETKVSEAVKVNDLTNMVGYIDDTDSRIIYTGTWGDWKEAVNHNGTIKFIENPVGTETATLTFVGTGIEVITCKNSDRGKFEISIDGKVIEEVDTYSSKTERKATVYSKSDLDYGKHTIKVRATNTKSQASSRTKVELDAFKVLNTNIQKPASISVGTKSGITTISKENSSLQMVATVLPNEIKNKEVIWSLNEDSLATINQNGILTTKTSNGTVVVTATSKEDPSISGSASIKIAIPTDRTEEVIVEDADKDSTKNSNITWYGSWSVWAGEPTKHHGGTKTEANTGAKITYKFNGTGIEVYSQKHFNFSSFDISIDGQNKGNFSLEGSGSGDNQQLVASFKDLSNGEHTIVMTAVDRSGKKQVNLDYFKVFKSVDSNIVDKSELQTEIEAHSDKVKSSYTSQTWDEFKKAYDNAVTVNNNDDSTMENVRDAIANLRDKAGKLVEQEAQNPVIPEGSEVEAIGVETKTLVLTWPSIDGASKYEIYKGETKIGETTDNYYRVNELTPNTEYSFTVKVINESGKSTSFKAIKVKTQVPMDTERPINVSDISVEEISKSSVKVLWSQATDNVGVVGYKIYLNGILKAKVDGLNYTIEGLDKNVKYTVKIVAVDEAGNTSLVPASKEFTLEDEEVPPTKPVDKSELEKLVNSVKDLSKDKYTTESWSKLESALEKANGILSKKDATVEEVAEAKKNLSDAISNLKRKPIEIIPTKPVDKSELEKLVNSVKDLSKDKYTTESWSKLESALEKANGILSKKDATVEEVAEAKKNLSDAISNLKRKPIEIIPTKPVDKSELEDLVNSIKNLVEDEYTEESWANLEEALEMVNNVLDNKYATAEEVEVAKKNLMDAIENLEKVSNENIDNEENSDHEDGTDDEEVTDNEDKNDKDTTSTSKPPKTADMNKNYILLSILFVSVLGLMSIRKKKIS